MYRRIAALMLCALLAVNLAGAWAEAALTLPPGLRVIEEEAFQGLPGPGAVALSEGIEEIGPRAFADSGITEIYLPASLKAIADDAFQNSALATVTAPEGSVAWEWAVAQGYIRLPLEVKVRGGAASALTGDPVTWNVSAQGGSGKYRYRYELYRGDAEIFASSYVASGVFTYTMTEPGSYTLVCTVNDGFDTASDSAVTEVTRADALTLQGIQVTGRSNYLSTQTHTWTANASGGAEPYRYRFELTQNGQSVASRDYAASATYTHTFTTPGSYTLRVIVTDAEGETAEGTLPFDANPVDGQVTGVIRIYLILNSSGEVDESNPGHYELMLDNGDEGITFDGHDFGKPVLSYNSAGGGSSAGMLTIYDSSVMPWSGAYMYTYRFLTTASKVLQLLENSLADWLDTEAETPGGGGYRYPVTRKPFNTYSVANANCFLALGQWCNVLGYPTIANYASGKKASAYYTPAAYNAFGYREWTFAGKI